MVVNDGKQLAAAVLEGRVAAASSPREKDGGTTAGPHAPRH